MKVAVVFPGQGSQNKSMLDSFEETIMFKNIIDEGVLNTFLLDTYSASQLKSKSTGNSGYSNILVESSKKMLSNLIESIDDGILVTEMMGSGANMLTGDYSRGAFGYLIEKGKISYPVTNFIMASIMIDMLKIIEEFSSPYLFEWNEINFNSNNAYDDDMKEKRDRWIESLKNDIYVDEAMNLLKDINSIKRNDILSHITID